MKIKDFKKASRQELNNVDIPAMSESVKDYAKTQSVLYQVNDANNPIKFTKKRLALCLSCFLGVLIVVFGITFIPTSSAPKNYNTQFAKTVDTKANLVKILEDNNESSFIYKSSILRGIGSAKGVDNALGAAESPIPGTAADYAASENSASLAPKANDYSETTSQVEGIAEADVIKVDSKHIYYASQDEGVVWVYDYNQGITTLVKTIDLKPVGENECIYSYMDVDLFVTDQYLIIFYATATARAYGYADSHYYYYYDYNNIETIVDVYNTNTLEREKELVVPGCNIDARVYDDVLYFVTYKYLNSDYTIPEYSGYIKSQEFDTAIGYDELIYVPYSKNSCLNYIVSLNLNNLEHNVSCQLGTSDVNIYMSTNALYLATCKYSYYESSEFTTIYKYVIGEDKLLKFSSSAKVVGSVLNQYSLDEYNGYLRVVTTDIHAKNQSKINKIFVLEEKEYPEGKLLEVAGKLEEGIGKPGERVKSVSFNGEYVNVVTYRNTDPLYLIKFTNDTEIEIVDALQIPGYSAYLVKLIIDGKEYRLGVGVEDDLCSYKISLYLNEDEKVTQVGSDFVLSSYYEETNGDVTRINYSYINMEAFYNIRALFKYQDGENTFIGFGTYEYRYNYYRNETEQDYNTYKYYVLSINPDGVEAISLVNTFIVNSDKSRMIYAQGYYYLLSDDQADGYKYNNETSNFELVQNN